MSYLKNINNKKNPPEQPRWNRKGILLEIMCTRAIMRESRHCEEFFLKKLYQGLKTNLANITRGFVYLTL